MSEPERDRAVGRGLAPAVLNPFFFIKINKHTARGGAPYARGGSYRAGGDGQGAIFLPIYAHFMRAIRESPLRVCGRAMHAPTEGV